MSRKIDSKNNFKAFQSDFEKDIGLEANNNMELYIQYANCDFPTRPFK